MKYTSKNIWSRFSLAIFLLGMGGSAGQAAEKKSAANFEVKSQDDILFAEVDGVKLLLDLHLPVGVENPPLVMFIHGGGWKNGDRKRCRLKWVVPWGYAVASIEYRLSQEAVFPAQIHDCKGALRWLRAHQKQYGYNAQRVVVAGTSAGGHLAALLGTSGRLAALEGDTANHTEQSSLAQGVIDYYGPSDFILRDKNQPQKTREATGSVYQLLGGSVQDKLKLASLASPTTHVGEGDPRLFVLHGEDDKLVTLSQSERLVDLYRANNLDVQFRIEPKKGHGWRPTTEGEQQQVLDFLEKCLR